MIKHVIVEGPDGGGKSTTVELLINKRGMTRAPRASTSLGGPLPHLAAYALDQEQNMLYSASHLVYDRHPVISEMIYGPLIRGKCASWEFENPGWVAARKIFLEDHCIIVWCITDPDTLILNVREGDQMPGVRENIRTIDHMYRERVRSWNGLAIVRDYATQDVEDFLTLYDYYQNS